MQNPQIVGFIPFIIGTILVANSRKLLVHGALTILVYVLFPFTEEPWLKEQFGREYENYCEQTPRFTGRETVKQLMNE